MIKKGLSMIMIAVLSMFVTTFLMDAHAGTVSEPLMNDSFDGGLDEDKWQIVNDPNETIGFAGFAGTLRYADVTGAEEAMVTTNPLTTGVGVTGYSVEFDFKYLSADWGDWFAFAFNKTEVIKGLDWGKGGYLMARNTSLQVNNPSDSVDGLSAPNPGVVTSFEEMTPSIANIANQNVRFKFVYTSDDQNLNLYYDLVSETMDLTTLRNSFTFGSLTDTEDYHFAIVSSGKGLYELDNLVINKLTDTDPIEYVDADFETNELPEEITLADSTKFSYGPAQSLEFNDVDAGSRFISKNAFAQDPNVAEPLVISYQQDIQTFALDKKFGFLYGLSTPDAAKTDEGVVEIYFVNRDVEGVVTTFIGAVVGDGEQVVQVLNETALPVNLLGYGSIDVTLSFGAFNNVYVNLDDSLDYQFKGLGHNGYFGFNSDPETLVLVDNFESKQYTFYDQSDAPDLFENFNTDYIDESLWDVYNYKDLRPGSELPLFPSTQGIHVSNGKLVFDVAGESARIMTMHDYANVEVRFDLEDFGVSTTEKNVDGEIDGVEVPPTYYVALSFGYEDTTQNFWNVPSIIFQARDGGAVIYTLNMNDNTVYPIDPALLLSGDQNIDETFEFKIVAIDGNVDIWMKRSSDPDALFNGEPLVSYTDVNTVGKVAIASSAAGSFKLDNLSIVKTGGFYEKPEIEDSIAPEKLVAPQIEVVQGQTVLFEQNSDTNVDFKTYFTATDNGDDVTITDDMIDDGNFDITTVGVYHVTILIEDEDGNKTEKTIAVSVYPEVVEDTTPIDEEPTDNEPNVALISILTGIGALAVGSGGAFFILKKTKKF